jgi:hypothetical protein
MHFYETCLSNIFAHNIPDVINTLVLFVKWHSFQVFLSSSTPLSSCVTVRPALH